jgi:lipoate synthase
MSNDKTKWEDIKFPIIRNVNPRLLSDDIEGIPTEDMPRRMNEMYQSVFNHAVEKINKELNEIRNIEGKEERIKYLEELLAAWS